MVPQLSFCLLVAACFSLAVCTDAKLNRGTTGEVKGFLASFLGEGRRLFANHFFTRSDVYFHSGYYPSIFDQANAMKENHLAEGAGAKKANAAHGEPGHVHDEHEDEDEHSFMGRPRDFMDAFSRHFIVSKHTHLGERGTNAVREILPWLKLAAQMDPNKVETYTVAAFWLRDTGKPAEAEAFLRDGLRHNPHSVELNFELGRCAYDRKDYIIARNLFELSLREWDEQEAQKPAEQQNRFLAEQVANYLACLEARAGNREKAVAWLQRVRSYSPFPTQVDHRIEEAKAGKLLD